MACATPLEMAAAAFKLLVNIDWEQLHEQKEWLVVAMNLDVDDADDEDAREGLLTLLDALQDFAVDSLGLSEAVVFGPDFGKEDADGAAVE